MHSALGIIISLDESHLQQLSSVIWVEKVMDTSELLSYPMGICLITSYIKNLDSVSSFSFDSAFSSSSD